MLEVHEGLIIARKYRLARPLAKGGMGSVWTALHVTLDVPVAVKFMHPRHANSNDLRARFEREAKSAAQLRSPNVVQILDYGIEEATPYLVMERLVGEDLGERLAKDRRLTIHEAVPILTQIGKALRRAHEERIVHRDLKPGNVFLVDQDDELLVKVLDFGIAKWLRLDGVADSTADAIGDSTTDAVADSTTAGSAIGSPHWMSPEQVRGVKDIDHRADLWALGVITYRILTGHLPFPGVQHGEIFMKICGEHPIAPTLHVPDLDPQVDAFITKALAVDVEQRFQNIKEMMDALAQLTTRPSISVTLAAEETEVSEDATTTTYQPNESREQVESTMVSPEKAMVLVDELPINVPVTQPIPTETETLRLENVPIATTTKRGGVIIAVMLGLVLLFGFYMAKQSEKPTESPVLTASITPTTLPIVIPVATIEDKPPQPTPLPSNSAVSPEHPQDTKKIEKHTEKTKVAPPKATRIPTIPTTIPTETPTTIPTETPTPPITTTTTPNTTPMDRVEKRENFGDE